MIKILLLILIFLIGKDNLLIYQMQYYELKRFIKVKISNIKYKYLYFIPFVILDLLINNNIFIIISLCFLILLSLNNKKKIILLKYTCRIKRIIFIKFIMIFAVSFFINKYFLLFTFGLIIFDSFLLIISNYIDGINRVIINYYSIKKLKVKLKSIKPIIIGITGSYGKTSTKNYLESILKLKYNVLKTRGNINTYKGVIKYLNDNLTSEIEILIIEIGLDRKRGINKFLKLFKFDYAFLTGIEKCHLSTFKSIENIINEKIKLINYSKVGFINIDNNYLKETTHNSYSLCDLEYLKFNDSYMMFKLKKINQEFKTYIIGDHQILNIIGVIKFLIYFNFDIKLIYQGVLKLRSEPHRYELKKTHDLLIIDDAYNANETSFKYAINSLKYFSQKKVLMTPGIIELGNENEKINYRIGLYIINKFDEIILIGQNSLNIKKAFDDNKFYKYKYFQTYQEGIEFLKNKKDKNFITLIENDLPDYYLK